MRCLNSWLWLFHMKLLHHTILLICFPKSYKYYFEILTWDAYFCKWNKLFLLYTSNPLADLKSSIRLCMANLYNFNAFVLQRLTLSRGQYIFSIRSIFIKFLTVKGVFISLLCSWKEQSLPRRFSSLWSSRYRRGHAPLSLAHLLHLS